MEFGGALPLIEADVFSVWSATSEKLRDVLRREGEVITCPELGTCIRGRAGRREGFTATLTVQSERASTR